MHVMKNVRLLPKNTKDVWGQIAHEINGQLIHGEIGQLKIQKSYANWIIKLDITGRTGNLLGGVGGTRILRVRSPYLSEDGFQFKISRKTIWSNLRALISFKQVKTEYPSFDKSFLLRGNSAENLLALLNPVEIRNLIEKQREFLFEAKVPSLLDGLPSNVRMLQFQTLALAQTIHNVEQIKSVFHLHQAVLDQLCEIGSASPNSVDHDCT